MTLSEKRKQAIRRGISDVMSAMRARVWDRMYEQSLASEQMTYDRIRLGSTLRSTRRSGKFRTQP